LEEKVSLARLGGWWRLWIVLTCLWTVRAGVVAWETWPAAPPVSPGSRDDPKTGKPIIYLDDNGNPLPREPISTDPLYFDKLAALPGERRQAALDDVWFWLWPPLYICVFGLASRWVYRGFVKASTP
jgi:hypothetical protein